ncbi:MAG: CrcB family protein [Planctomycetota bacterium]|nr:CrcB family protein [Planctomycetota bacterium]
MLKLALVMICGSLGTALRFGVVAIAQRLSPATSEHAAWPWGTFVVNLAGCVAIGYLATMFAGRWPVREEVRLAVLVGILGGFTTFSSFAWEGLDMFQRGDPVKAIAYVVASNVLGLGCAWLGATIART